MAYKAIMVNEGHKFWVFVRVWELSAVEDAIRGSSHNAVVVASAESSPQSGVVPVLRRFEDQKMEDRIIGYRYRTAQVHFGRWA